MTIPERTTRIDEVSSTLTYVGIAPVSASESAAVWSIQRLENIGTVLTITWADGDTLLDNVWADRASLSYE